MSVALRNSKLVDSAPSSISYDDQVQSACSAFDPQMYEIIDDTGSVIMIPSILSLTDDTLVDILAWQFHVDFYDKTRDIAFRKQLVQLSIQWHMTKGTMALVKSVLDLYFPGVATLEEWYQYHIPFPPNYPVNDLDALIATFGPSNVNISTDTFTITGHGLTANQQVRFEPGVTSLRSTGIVDVPTDLPAPLVKDIFYYVISPTTNTFKVSPSMNGSPVDLTTAGTGTANQLWKRGSGSWHDRYRFRVVIDEQFVDPTDLATAMALINAYKPVSRWMEGFVRATSSECDIGWTGMLLKFTYITSEAPDYP